MGFLNKRFVPQGYVSFLFPDRSERSVDECVITRKHLKTFPFTLSSRSTEAAFFCPGETNRAWLTEQSSVLSRNKQNNNDSQTPLYFRLVEGGVPYPVALKIRRALLRENPPLYYATNSKIKIKGFFSSPCDATFFCIIEKSSHLTIRALFLLLCNLKTEEEMKNIHDWRLDRLYTIRGGIQRHQRYAFSFHLFLNFPFLVGGWAKRPLIFECCWTRRERGIMLN